MFVVCAFGKQSQRSNARWGEKRILLKKKKTIPVEINGYLKEQYSLRDCSQFDVTGIQYDNKRLSMADRDETCT